MPLCSKFDEVKAWLAHNYLISGGASQGESETFHDRFWQVSIGTMFWHDGARQIAGLSHIGARLMYRPIRDPTASSWALHGPSGPDRPPADRRRRLRTLLHRSLPSLGGPQLLLAQPMLLVSEGLGWQKALGRPRACRDN